MLLIAILGLCTLASAVTYKPVGETCVINADCSSNNCRFESNAGGYTCGAVHVGYACRYGDDCTSHSCDIQSGSIGTCVFGTVGKACADNTDCSSSFCNGGVCRANVNDPLDTQDPCHVNSDCTSGSCGGFHCKDVAAVVPWTSTFDQCFGSADCTSRICEMSNGASFRTCQQRGLNGRCGSNSDCTSNNCDLTNGPIGRCAGATVGSSCVEPNDCITRNCVGRVCRRNSAGSRCASNDDCLNGICLLDQLICANEIGSGCVFSNSATQNTQCITQQCSAAAAGDTGVCLPGTAASGGSPCYLDVDCITFNCSTSWANAPHTYNQKGSCLPSQAGTRCEVDDDCTSTNCVNFQCTPNSVGSSNTNCQFNSDCTSNLCDCSSGGGACHQLGVYGICTAVSPFSPCAVDGDCIATGSTCDPTSKLCTALPTGSPCSDSSWCVSNFCDFSSQSGVCAACTSGFQCGSFNCNNGGICTKSQEGGPCLANADCTTRVCGLGQCIVSSVGGYCQSEIDCTSLQCGTDGICKANSFGNRCRLNTDCVTGLCSACDVTGACLTDPGTCQATTAGRACAVNADCNSGVCQSGVCQVSVYLGHCGVDADCPPYLFCSPPTSATICGGDNTVETVNYPHCDLNACFANNGFCDDKATCTPLKCHQRQCACNQGYFGRGNAITPDLTLFHTNANTNLPIDERPGCHSPCVPGLCDANADCVAISLLITTCRCKEGFLGPGYPGQCYLNPCLETSVQLGLIGGCEFAEQMCVLDLTTTVQDTRHFGGVPFVAWSCPCAPGFYPFTGSEGGSGCSRKPRNACNAANAPFFGGDISCQCGTGKFVGAYASSVCAPNGAGGICLEDNDCTTLNCALDLNRRPVGRSCQVSEVYEPCAQDSDCTSQNCDTQKLLTCQPNGYNGGCVTNRDCQEGLWCFTPFVDDVPPGASTAPRCVLNKCASVNGGCDSNGWCTPLGDNIHICSCPPNFFGTGYRFNPEFEGTGCTNPCLKDNGGCWVDPTFMSADRATCKPTSYKSVECTCPKGKVGDGVGQWGCLDDVCGGISLPHQQVGTSGAQIKLFYGCPVDAHCITVTVKNSQDGYLSCKCERDGYVYSEPTATATVSLLGACVPNPCKVVNGGCGDNAICNVDLWARPVCTCRNGYSPQGTAFAPGTATCLSNPCGTIGVDGKPDNGGCDPRATCLTRAQVIARGGSAPALDVQRVCVCNLPYQGDGLHCLDDPCRTLPNFCKAYANTICSSIYIAPSGTGGPEVGVGPQLQPTCACLFGYFQSNALDQNGFAACAPGCGVNNGNCDETTTTCSQDGNRVICRCKPGYGILNAQGAISNLGGVVPAGQACAAVNCDLSGITLPANTNGGTCTPGVAAGETCNLACDPSFSPAGGDDITLVRCVASTSSSAAPSYVLPTTRPICVSASQLPPPAKSVKSPRGSGWTCTSTGGVVSCAPATPTLRKSWSESTHTGSLTVTWKALGTSVPVTRLDVILSGDANDLVDVIQIPSNPQPNPTKAGTTIFTRLHPGKRYTVMVVATVRTSAAGVTPEETIQYATQSYEVVACSATC